MRALIQHPGDETIIIIEDVDPDRPIVELIGVDEGELVWIDGCDEPVELHRTLIEVGVARDCHVVHGHKHRCRTIDLHVTYVGTTKEHTVSPPTTLETLLKWAIRAFGIDTAAAADLVFRVVGSGHDLGFERHVGSLTHDHHCSVALELLPIDTPAG